MTADLGEFEGHPITGMTIVRHAGNRRPRQDYRLTAVRLREVVSYNPDTGEFLWLRPTSHRVRPGSAAGSRQGKGYRRISIDGTAHQAHRLAWLYVHGVWPPGDLDHRNEVKNDNRILNLRPATAGQNNQNKSAPRSDNTSGFLGVTRKRRGWIAQIQVDGRRSATGQLTTPEEAYASYLAAKADLHPFWAGAK